MEVKKIEATTEKRDGKLIAVASTENKDRVGDILKLGDWDLRNYKKNPVLQAGHDYRPQFTIGVAKNIKVEDEKLVFEPLFHSFTQLAREIKDMYENGILKAWSVGFIPAREEGGKNELLEVSSVAIPANADALTIAKGMNQDEEIKLGKEIKEWVMKSVEEYVEEKPYPGEHACRLVSPDDCNKFRRVNDARDHDGKKYDVIYGHMKDEDKWVDQAFRYDKAKWKASEAKSHCGSHDGTFEAASEKDEIPPEPNSEQIPNTPIDESPENIPTEPTEIKPEEIKKPQEENIKESEIKESVEEKEGRVISTKNRQVIGDTISKLKETTVALEKLLELSEPLQKEEKEIQAETPEKSKGDGENKGRDPKMTQKSGVTIDQIIVRALQRIAKESNFALHKNKQINKK